MATYWYENTLRNYGIPVKRSRMSPCLCWLVRTCCAQTVELSVGWCTMTPMWCYYYNNVAKRLTFELRHRSHFHNWNFDRLSYLFRLEWWFVYSLPRRSFTRTMVHTCTVSVCRRTDRRTDKVQPITNILLPPSQEENGIAIALNVLWC